MTIETKFGIGDNVWFISKDTAKYTKVIGINILCTADKINISYTYDSSNGFTAANENKVFGSKQELLDSL